MAGVQHLPLACDLICQSPRRAGLSPYLQSPVRHLETDRCIVNTLFCAPSENDTDLPLPARESDQRWHCYSSTQREERRHGGSAPPCQLRSSNRPVFRAHLAAETKRSPGDGYQHTSPRPSCSCSNDVPRIGFEETKPLGHKSFGKCDRQT